MNKLQYKGNAKLDGCVCLYLYNVHVNVLYAQKTPLSV